MAEKSLMTPVEKEILERIQEIEKRIEAKGKDTDQKVNLLKLTRDFLSKVFCRQNLELFLSLSALAVSLSVAFYLFAL